jgi:hypothetical protein
MRNAKNYVEMSIYYGSLECYMEWSCYSNVGYYEVHSHGACRLKGCIDEVEPHDLFLLMWYSDFLNNITNNEARENNIFLNNTKIVYFFFFFFFFVLKIMKNKTKIKIILPYFILFFLHIKNFYLIFFFFLILILFT